MSSLRSKLNAWSLNALANKSQDIWKVYCRQDGRLQRSLWLKFSIFSTCILTCVLDIMPHLSTWPIQRVVSDALYSVWKHFCWCFCVLSIVLKKMLLKGCVRAPDSLVFHLKIFSLSRSRMLFIRHQVVLNWLRVFSIKSLSPWIAS